MKNISDAADLMATARDALLQDVLPSLPKDQRYAGLMIANVMAIAAREHRSGRDAATREAQRLRDLLAAIGAETAGELPALRRAVCTAIREGRFDEGARDDELQAHLAQTAADWVAISNPKALRAEASP